MPAFDVVVVGAGPAGATAALNLAPTRRVALVERRSRPQQRIGESLPPAARRLLADMGLHRSFLAQGHVRCHGNRAVWGADTPVETDFLRDPDGHGWHLDRARFEAWLRASAVARGATFLAPARIKAIERVTRRWRVHLTTALGDVAVDADVVIDAGGRSAPVARRLGATRRALDRLVCGWVYGRADKGGRGAGFTHIEATEHGWWYTAPLPVGRVLAFHTDADLPAARIARDRESLLHCAGDLAELSAVLAESGFVPEPQSAITAAHSTVLEPCFGPGWLATGDAALSFDPLSGQGILNALFTGLAAAEAVDRYLSGTLGNMAGYGARITRIHQEYRRHLALWYAAETRWPKAPFWRRRRESC